MSGFNLSRAERREAQRYMARESAKYPAALVEIPREQWPNPAAPQLRVLRSREFLLQEFHAPAPALVRLSVNRTSIAGDRWAENITWDELQRLKAEAGYGTADAVEVFPAAADVVNVANMRHLWVLREQLTFKWKRGE
jgi:hypothetical protein